MGKKNHVPNHQPVMFRPLKPSFLTNSNWSIRNTQCFGTPSGLPHAIALGTACTCTGVPHPRTHCLVLFRHLPYAKVSWNHHHDRLKENTPISYIRNSQACDSFPPPQVAVAYPSIGRQTSDASGEILTDSESTRALAAPEKLRRTWTAGTPIFDRSERIFASFRRWLSLAASERTGTGRQFWTDQSDHRK